MSETDRISSKSPDWQALVDRRDEPPPPLAPPQGRSSTASKPAVASPAPWNADYDRIPDGIKKYDAVLFSNPTLRLPAALQPSQNNAGSEGGTGAPPEVKANSPCAKLAPPPPIPLGPGLPTSAPNAISGIHIRALAENLPAISRTATDSHVLTAGQYKLHPALARQPDNTEAVVYWVAVNTDFKRSEYVVGPDALTQFISAPNAFAGAAGLTYAHGEPAPWERESMKAVDSAMSGEAGDAVSHLGKSWLEAVKDPNWWIQNTVAVGGAAVAAGEARGAGALERRAPQSPRIATAPDRVAPIVPEGGLRAHENGIYNGHTLRKHVHVTDVDLIKRANQLTPPREGASRFYNQEVAEMAATRTLESNEGAIEQWLASEETNPLTIEHHPNDIYPFPVGRHVAPKTKEITDVAGTRLMLIKDPTKTACGFGICTGYPIR